MLQKRNLINMFSGGIGFVFPMALNLIFTPYIINNLGNQGYGLQNLVNILIGYLMVADMGLDLPITNLVSRYQTEKNTYKLSQVILTTFQIYFYMGVFGASVLALGSEYLVYSYFKIPAELAPEAIQVFLLTAIGFFASLVNMWGKAIFNGLQRYEISNSVSILQTLGALLAGVWLISQGYGVLGFVLAKIIFICLSGIIYLVIVFRSFVSEKFKLGIDLATWHHLKSQIGYGVVLRLSGMILARLDQTFIASFIGVASVGLYAIPLLIANAISSLMASLTHFTFPKVVELNTSRQVDELNKLFYKGTRFITLLATFLFLPFITFGDKFIGIWVNPEAGESLKTVSFLVCLGIYLNALTNIILNNFMVGLGKLKIFTIYSFSRGIFLGLSYYVFIKLYGLNGAGLSLLLACLIDILFLNFCINKFLNIARVKFYLEVYAKPLLVTAILVGVGHMFKGYVSSWFTFIFASGTLSLSFVVLMIFLRYISKSEMNLVGNFIHLGYNKLRQSL